MKRILMFIIGGVLLLPMAGCRNFENIVINTENAKDIHNSSVGMYCLVEIGNGLWYDETTRIAYWWNGALDSGAVQKAYSTTPSAYYAPNGLPYKYNPETRTLGGQAGILGS